LPWCSAACLCGLRLGFSVYRLSRWERGVSVPMTDALDGMQVGSKTGGDCDTDRDWFLSLLAACHVSLFGAECSERLLAGKILYMLPWKFIIDIGHTAVMLPLAAAIATWLIAGRAWERALYWCLMAGAGLSLVALSKIAFLGWGAGIPSLEFKALSGHALCATAVIPVLFFVALHTASISWRTGGVVLGFLVSIGLGVLLVHFRFHTASEVIASFVLGALISLGYMRIATTLPAPCISPWTVLLSIIVFVVIFGLKPFSINHRLVDVALHLSGRDRPYDWSKKSICAVRRPVNR
jgi:hypothetical protein